MLGPLCQISMDIGELSPANNRALYYVQKHTAVIFSVTGSGELIELGRIKRIYKRYMPHYKNLMI